ncbi:putative ankyrin repeat domain-containing protein [Arabidopsis thaliana]
MARSSPANIPATTIDDYAHSPVHYAVVVGDHAGLTRLVSSLPKLTDPEQIHTESDSMSQERVAEKISTVIDRRDVPFGETPLHLAVRLGDVFAAKTISSAGADITLQNAAGWNSLHEALCRRNSEITEAILRDHHRSAWCKWRRRLPHLIAVLSRMRDFYMEISFHFESSVIPFVGKIAPSDTYKIWKRGGDLRADTSLAGFDGFKIRRANQSFLFLSDGDEFLDVSPGTLLVLNRDDKTILNAFENAKDPISDSDIAGFCGQSSLYRPGMDVTKAKLVEITNWRRQAKIETVGEWKAKAYDVENVSFSFKSRKVGTEQGLRLDETRRSVSEPLRPQRREQRRRSVSLPEAAILVANSSVGRIKEKEIVKSLRPSVWLTDQFPLKTEELLPLLDILANHVKAVRRMRELLTTKFPAGTFPVKLSIPVIPTVKVVMTFSKFVALPPLDEFYTPLSSPKHLLAAMEDQHDVHDDEKLDRRISSSRPSFSTPSWLRLNINATGKSSRRRLVDEEQVVDPFTIPTGYKWTSNSDNSVYILHISTYLAHPKSVILSLVFTKKSSKNQRYIRYWDHYKMASEAPSWADQWGTGGIGVMAAEETTDGKKDVTGKKSGKTKAGINKAKIVVFIGVNWMKNLVQRKKKDSTSS